MGMFGGIAGLDWGNDVAGPDRVLQAARDYRQRADEAYAKQNPGWVPGASVDPTSTSGQPQGGSVRCQ
jgi:hypothetical protein